MVKYEDLELVFANDDPPEYDEIDEEVFSEIAEGCDLDED